MKKSFLILAAIVSLATFQAFGQTISVNGTSATGSAGSTFTLTLSLTVSGTNTIGNVESVNMLLRTLNGSAFFTLGTITPISPFTLANNGAASTFNTSGDAANSGFTVSNPSIDEGANAPAVSAAPVAGTGTTTFNFETIQFISSGSTPAGVYHFSTTLGGIGDAQGSWVDNSNNATFDINSAPDFTITIAAVPEPATLSLVGLGALGALGMTILRRRRTS
jgi:hypothetical protein